MSSLTIREIQCFRQGRWRTEYKYYQRVLEWTDLFVEVMRGHYTGDRPVRFVDVREGRVLLEVRP